MRRMLMKGGFEKRYIFLDFWITSGYYNEKCKKLRGKNVI